MPYVQSGTLDPSGTNTLVATATPEPSSLVLLGTSAADTSGRAPPVLLGLAELLLSGKEPDGEARAQALAHEALAADPLSVSP